MKMRQILLAGVLVIVPVATAFAQSYGPEVGADNQRESHKIAEGYAPSYHARMDAQRQVHQRTTG